MINSHIYKAQGVHVLKKAVPDSQWYPVNLYLIYGRYIVFFFYLEKCLILTFSPIGETRVLYILLKYVNILFYLQIEFLSRTANYKRSAFCLCWNIFNHILISHSKSVKNSMRWHYKIRINRVSHIILDRYWLLNRFSESEILRKIIHFMKLCKANIKICCRKHKGFLVTYFGVEAWRWYGMRSVLKLQSLKKYKISNKKSTLDG